MITETLEFNVRVAPDTILGRNETLSPGFGRFKPTANSPCWKMQFNKRTMQIAVSGEIVQSTCEVCIREDFPSVYIGGEPGKAVCVDENMAQIWAASINDYIYSNLAAEQLATMSEYVLENWLNHKLQMFSFWSSRIHPEDAIEQSGSIRNKKGCGTKPRNKRASKHQIANEVANASKDLDSVVAYVEKLQNHQLVGKAEQEIVAPLAIELENNEVKGNSKGELVYTQDKLRQIEDEIDAKKTALPSGKTPNKKRQVHPVQDRTSNQDSLRKVKLVAVLPVHDAYALCQWCLKEHKITLCTLDQGMDATKVVQQAVYRPVSIDIHVARSIAAKAGSMQHSNESNSQGNPVCIACNDTGKNSKGGDCVCKKGSKIASPEVAKQIVFDLPNDSKGNNQVGFVYDTPGKGSFQINFIVVANGANYLYKDAKHLGGSWSNAAKAIGNKSLHAAFRTKLQAAVNRLQKRKSEVAVVYNPTDKEVAESEAKAAKLAQKIADNAELQSHCVAGIAIAKHEASTKKPAGNKLAKNVVNPPTKIEASELVAVGESQGMLIEETDRVSIATPERAEDGLLDEGWGEWIFDVSPQNMPSVDSIYNMLNG